MKVLAPITCLLLLAQTANAQIQKGDLLPGFTLNYYKGEQKTQIVNSQFPEEVKGWHLYANGSILYALDSNNLVGISFGLNYNENSPSDQPYMAPYVSQWGLGALYQRNKRILPRFYAYANAGVYYSFGTRPTLSDLDAEVTSLAIAIRPGMYYFLTRHIAVELSFGNMGYYDTYMKYDTVIPGRAFLFEEESTSEEFIADFSFATIQYGIRFRF